MTNLMPLTAELLEYMQRLRDNGCGWAGIAREVGLSPDTVKRRLKPGYREQRNAGIRYRRMLREGKEACVLPPKAIVSAGNVRFGRITPEEEARALASIPTDTRDLTARIMGDPIPGRRAIDMRAGA